MAEATLQPIQERLNGVSPYHPFSADTFADWTMEAGDIVTISRGSNEYHSPVHSSTLVWRRTPVITVNSTGNKERESIATVSRKKYNRSGAGMRNQQGLHQALYSADGYLRSVLDFTESYFRTIFEDDLNYLRGEVEQTAGYWRSTYEDTYNGLVGQIEQTASYWRSAYQDAQNNIGDRKSVV